MNKMRLVFLDFDGVVAPLEYGEPRRPVLSDLVDGGIVEFDCGCVAELNLICDTGRAFIVVSSSWRYAMKDLLTCRAVLHQQGIRAPVIGMTETFPEYGGKEMSRWYEIKRYLMGIDDLESFVILDDCDMGFSEVKLRWVKTSLTTGLTRRDAVAALAILETPLSGIVYG